MFAKEKKGLLGFMFLAGAALIIIGLCSCSETEQAADVILDEITGKRAIEQGKRMKEELQQIREQQADRLQKIEKIKNE